MFEKLSRFRTVIVTGPHRSGTTICAEMVGHDTGLTVYREEAFGNHSIRQAEPLLSKGGVFQGPYLLPWTPILAGEDTMVLYLDRPAAEVEASVQRLVQRGISQTYFSRDQAARLWTRIRPLLPRSETVAYHALRDHPLWVEKRPDWHHRQTR